MKYLIVVEKTGTGYSAYSPDIDGCIATGSTKDKVEKNMKGAIGFHLEELKLEKQEISRPNSYSDYLEVSA